MDTRSASRWQVPIAISALSAIAFAVRLPAALQDSLWGDEVASARAVFQPTVHGLLQQVELRESTPPAWYLLAWVLHLVGAGTPELRLLSVLFSTALAGLTVRYAARLMPLSAAALAGLAVALGLAFVIHGREMRAYALFMLVVLLFTIAVEAAADDPRPLKLVALAACVSIGILTHYFFVCAVVVAVLWLLWLPASGRVRARVAAALCVGTLPFLLWVSSFVAQSRTDHTRWIGGFNPLKYAYIHSTFFADAGLLYHQGATVPRDVLNVTGRLGFLAVVTLASLLVARAGPRGKLCALMTLVPVAIPAVVSLFGPDTFDVRNLLEIAPFTAIGLAYAISRLPRRGSIAVGALAVPLLVASYAQATQWSPPPYEDVAATLVDEGWQRDQPIALFGNVSPFPHPEDYFPPALGWYLPAHPRLRLTGDSVASCTGLYVVAATPRGRRVVKSLARNVTTVGSIVIARVRPDARIASALQRDGAHFLHSRLHTTCAGSG